MAVIGVGDEGRWKVPITSSVVTHVIVSAPSHQVAACRAMEYWKKNYDDEDEGCFVEGRYVKGSAQAGSLIAEVKDAAKTIPAEYRPDEEDEDGKAEG